MSDRFDNDGVTRRKFLVVSAAAIGASALGTRALAQTPQQSPQPTPQQTPPPLNPVFTPVRRNVATFTARGGTIGYLVNSGGILVIDSQYPDSAKAFVDGLNAQTNGRKIDVLINTHHHADHTGGNPVFKPVTKTIVAQTKVPELQEIANNQASPPVEQAYADTTFEGTWNKAIGDEVVHATKFTPAHTGGDSVVYFEKANIVHVGDLVWGSLQCYVDRTPGGASATNWIKVTEQIAAKYPADATYIWGHSAAKLPVTGTKADVLKMRDYLTALVEYVRASIKAGKSRDQIIASKDVLPGFDERGPLTPRALAGTYDELAEK
jgi:glyoxylase-like metal-dependent hydrolase (beta-lactamase superfamily II)